MNGTKLIYILQDDCVVEVEVKDTDIQDKNKEMVDTEIKDPEIAFRRIFFLKLRRLRRKPRILRWRRYLQTSVFPTRYITINSAF